ncbi:MAG: aminotransferase class I/II-fold pyridoxal phosphate-dependent enzyme [Chloroflexota bacterium]|nr:aminotransferase class I/II-fold pyridoxal phosphate-dependent enzyme [Chloroflexota bacterium]
MRTIPDFELKRFFNEGSASTARANLSPSFAEPLSTADLLAFEPDAAAELTRLPLSYPGMHGGLELRAAIANQYRQLGPDAIVATCGADDALSLLFMALVGAGDHVIVQSPIYQPLTSVAEWCGAEITLWPASEQQAWQPPLEHLRRLLQPTTRLIVVNFPHSPTGFVPDQDYLEQLISLADDASITVICDEIYRGLPLTEAGEPPSLADLSRRAVVLNSLSKGYGLPGLRVGWVATRNEGVLAKVKHLRMHVNSFVGAPSEFLATLALRHTEQILGRNLTLAKNNLAQLQRFLTQHLDLFSWHDPRGGVVVYPRWLGEESTTVLSERLLQEAGLLLAPSAYFAADDRHVRIGFGTSTFPASLAAFEAYLASRRHG